jgi:hypothetical protein
MTARLSHCTVFAALTIGALAGGLMSTASCDFNAPLVTPGSVTPASAVSAAAGCPDISSIEAVARVDWVSEFGLDIAAAAKIRSGLQAALALDAFAGRIDAELSTACGGLARDLGDSAQFKNAGEACQAAARAVGSAKSQLAANARVSVAIQPPRCAASMSAMADCVAQCDAEIDPGSAEVQCEPGKLAGTCDGQCTGSCELQGAAQCQGTCNGSCSASFEGRCDGACKGSCNGAPIDGAACNGTCNGSCSAGARGQCGGQCQGSCELQGSAQCRGTCRGSCNVEMKSPRCEGRMTPPKASAECNARCDADVQAKVECTPTRVAVLVDGAANGKAAADFAAALQKHLPGVLKVAIGMKDQALTVAAQGRSVAEGMQAALASVKAAPQAGARLSACVAAPFQAAANAAGSIRANVDVSVQVQASASASASGSARAG